MTDASPDPPSAHRDDVFWLAVRAAYAAGVPADRASSIFNLPRSTLLKRARKEGWRRCDLRRDDGSRPAATAEAESPRAADAPRASRPSPAVAEPAADAASIVPRALAAADVALTRATEAAACADATAADAASRLGERLARMANVLGRTKTPPPRENPMGDAESRRNELLVRIDRALTGDRNARRLEVAELRLRGIDPREAWLWDEEDGDWTWNPGDALSKAAPPDADPQGARPDVGDEEPQG